MLEKSWVLWSPLLVKKAEIYDFSTMTNPMMESFAISTAHEAFDIHSENYKAARYIVLAFDKKYG